MHSARRHGVLTLCGEGRIRTCVGVGPTSDQVPVRPLRVPLHCCLRRFCCLVFCGEGRIRTCVGVGPTSDQVPVRPLRVPLHCCLRLFCCLVFAERAGFEPAWAL